MRELFYGDEITPIYRAANDWDIFLLRKMFWMFPVNDNLSAIGQSALDQVAMMFDVIMGDK